MTSAMTHPRQQNREPITADELGQTFTSLMRDLQDINAELKALNADHYLPSSIQPLVIAAVRQSGFAAEHLDNSLLVLSATQQKEANQ